MSFNQSSKQSSTNNINFMDDISLPLPIKYIGKMKRRGGFSNYVYTPLCDVKPNAWINVYAVVKFYKQPYKTKGSDYCQVMSVVDPTYHSHNKLKCVFFLSQEASFPPCNVGDIIRLHRLKVVSHDGELQGNSGSGFSWLLFKSGLDTPTDPYACSSRTYTLTDPDKDRLREIREWVATQEEFSQKEKWLRLCDVTVGDYFDIVCQVIGRSVLPTDNCVVLHVWDGTRPNNCVRVVDLSDADERVNDDDLQRTAESCIYDVMLFDDHYASALKMMPGDTVKLRNLHVVKCRGTPDCVTAGDTPPVEFVIHHGMSFGRGIAKLPDDALESKIMKDRLDVVHQLQRSNVQVQIKEEMQTSDDCLNMIDTNQFPLQSSAISTDYQSSTYSTQSSTPSNQPSTSNIHVSNPSNQPSTSNIHVSNPSNQPSTSNIHVSNPSNQPSTSNIHVSNPSNQPSTSNIHVSNPSNQPSTSNNHPSSLSNGQPSTSDHHTQTPETLPSSCDTCDIHTDRDSSPSRDHYDYETFRNILDSSDKSATESHHCMLTTRTVVPGHYHIKHTTFDDIINCDVPYKHKVLCQLLDYFPRTSDMSEVIKLYCPYCHFLSPVPKVGSNTERDSSLRSQLKVSSTRSGLDFYECPQCSPGNSLNYHDPRDTLEYIYMFKLVLVDKSGWVIANLWNHEAETFFLGQTAESMMRDSVQFTQMMSALERICVTSHNTRDECLLECCLRSFTSGDKINFEIFDTKLVIQE